MDELHTQAWNLVHAVGKMRDDWAESDEGYRKTLWSNVHAAADALREVLDGEAT